MDDICTWMIYIDIYMDDVKEGEAVVVGREGKAGECCEGSINGKGPG